MSSDGILTVHKNLSVTWNVDGVPLFKSSKFSLWLMYYFINELPYKLWTLKENSIFAGLWFGETKPNMSVFLKPIVTELIKLESYGIIVKSPAVPERLGTSSLFWAGWICNIKRVCMGMPTCTGTNLADSIYHIHTSH